MTEAELRSVADYPPHLRQYIIDGTVHVMPQYRRGRDEMEDER